MPINARSRALSGGPGEPGPLIATLTVTRANQNRSSSAELGQAAGRWDVSEAGEAAGFEARAGTTQLIAPPAGPPDWRSLEVIGGEEHSRVGMPWFGEIHNPAGVGGAIVALTSDERLSIRTHVNQSPREIRLFGADTAVSAGNSFRIHAVIG